MKVNSYIAFSVHVISSFKIDDFQIRINERILLFGIRSNILHIPIIVTALLGVIPRECPSTPLGELLFEVQTCKADSDCWPRICCPDGTRSYCRTARARLDLVPVANQIDGRQ